LINAKKPEILQKIIDEKLPLSHKNVVYFIVQWLRKLSEEQKKTMMGYDNLAMVFSPAFLRCPKTAILIFNAAKEKEVVETLLRYTCLPVAEPPANQEAQPAQEPGIQQPLEVQQEPAVQQEPEAQQEPLEQQQQPVADETQQAEQATGRQNAPPLPPLPAMLSGGLPLSFRDRMMLKYGTEDATTPDVLPQPAPVNST